MERERDRGLGRNRNAHAEEERREVEHEALALGKMATTSKSKTWKDVFRRGGLALNEERGYWSCSVIAIREAAGNNRIRFVYPHLLSAQQMRKLMDRVPQREYGVLSVRLAVLLRRGPYDQRAGDIPRCSFAVAASKATTSSV